MFVLSQGLNFAKLLQQLKSNTPEKVREKKEEKVNKKNLKYFFRLLRFPYFT
jgi:hypothetical protein